MSFVLTAGRVDRVRPAPATLSGAMIPGGVRLGPSTYQTYEQVWRSQPALRTVVEFLARNIAELGLDVFERSGETDRRKVRDHPLSTLLENPFPGSKWTKYRLINWVVQELCIFNSAIWLKMKTSTGTPALLPISRRMIEPQGDSAFAPDSYRLSGSRGHVDLKPEEVVHFFGYNPQDMRDGESPIETLRHVLAEEYSATRYREQMWRNGARMSGVITRPEKAGRWSDEARARLKADWSLYSSEGLAAGGTPILEDGMKYDPQGVTPRDAQYVESRQLTWEEVAIAYHINPAILGLAKGQTTGNLSELHSMLYADTLGPWLEMIQQDIERQLLPDLDPGAAGKIYLEFNLRKKLQGSFETQAAAISASVGGPWLLRNEARAMFNLTDVPEGDDLIVPLNVVTGGLASPRDTAPDNPSNEESNNQPPGPKPVTGRKP